jgi:hypothetical protein
VVQCYRELGETEQVNIFKKRLLDKFPNSDYAGKLRDAAP